MARSTSDFIAKMGIVQEEADESLYWLELLQEINLLGKARDNSLVDECRQILVMTISSIKTARNRK